MASKIDSLLKKTNWTGVEVGKALVASVVHDIRYQNDPDYKPLFSQSDFDKMEGSLTTEQDFLAYGVYRDIYSGLIDAYNRGQGQNQQFCNGYYRYAMHLKDCTIAERTILTAELTPYVLSKKQYTQLKKQRETALKGFQESFVGLFFAMLSYVLANPENVPETILRAIDATKQEPVTNKRILEGYNKAYGIGYYTLPDGTRSDSLDTDAWKEKLIEEYRKTHEYRSNGQSDSYEDIIQHTDTQSRLAYYKLFFDGIDAVKALYKKRKRKALPPEDETNIMRALENRISLKGTDNPVLERKSPRNSAVLQVMEIVGEEIGSGAEWHVSINEPINLTKYNILTESLFFYMDDANENLKEFQADYPALYTAMETYIKELVPQTRELTPAQYSDDFIRYGELADLGVGDYISSCSAENKHEIVESLAETDENTTENLLKRKRILLSGIVLAQNPQEYQLTEAGEYIDNIEHLLSFSKAFGIDAIGRSESQRREIQSFRNNLFVPALQYMYAFNALVKILGNVYDIAELKKVEIRTAHFESQLETFNHQLYMLYGDVYGTDADKERKRNLIKDVFQPTDVASLKPTKEAIKAVTEELQKLGLSTDAREKLRRFDVLMAKLCERGV